MKRRVVVTGLGMVSSVGLTLADSWNGLCRKEIGIIPISSPHIKVAGKLPQSFSLESALENTQQGKNLQNALFIDATIQAIYDAGYAPETELEQLKCGVIESIIASSAKDIFESAKSSLFDRQSWLKIAGGIATSNAAIISQAKGPCSSIAGGLQSIGDAFFTIKRGEADYMIVSGGSPEIDDNLAGFLNGKNILSNEIKPFGNDRNGTILGEGAASIVLEEFEHAKARGARIYAEMNGFGSKFNAKLNENDAVLKASNNGEFVPGIIFANGSGDKIEDAVEGEIIKKTYPNAKVSCIKSSIGHLLSAAGISESVIAILSLNQKIIPPMIAVKDPEFDLDFVTKIEKHKEKCALVHDIRFGIHSSAVTYSSIE